MILGCMALSQPAKTQRGIQEDPDPCLQAEPHGFLEVLVAFPTTGPFGFTH